MNSITTIVIAVLSSGVIAALVSAFMQKRNEREQRIFNARFLAYTNFVEHLESRFTTLTDEGKSPDLVTLMKISAPCLLVSSGDLNSELKHFFSFVDHLNKKCNNPDFDLKKEEQSFVEVWNKAEKIEKLMRKDLGFK